MHFGTEGFLAVLKLVSTILAVCVSSSLKLCLNNMCCVFCAGHDNKGAKPGWHLDLVEVTHLPSGRLYYFPCGRWLDSAQGGKIERTLKVTDFST